MEALTNKQLESSIAALRKESDTRYATKAWIGDKFLTKSTFYTMLTLLVVLLVGVISFQTSLIYRLDDRISSIGDDTAFIKGSLSEWELVE